MVHFLLKPSPGTSRNHCAVGTSVLLGFRDIGTFFFNAWQPKLPELLCKATVQGRNSAQKWQEREVENVGEVCQETLDFSLENDQ